MKNANPVSLGLKAAGSVVLSLFIAGCGSGKTENPAAVNSTVFDHFPIRVGGHPANLQIAVLPSEQERGLMQRPDLGQDDGMLFVKAKPGPRSFWMHDTPEALDLAYLTPEGVVAEVYDLLPLDERPVTSHSNELQFALEMPKGWFAAKGIRPGAKVDMKAVGEALKSRGFRPQDYGIN